MEEVVKIWVESRPGVEVLTNASSIFLASFENL